MYFRFLKHPSLQILAAAAVLVACSVAAPAGTITGSVFKPLWSNYTSGSEATYRGYAGIGVSAVKEGQLQEAGYGAAETGAGTPVGSYTMTGVAPGSYSVMFHEKDEFSRVLLFGQVVPTASPNILTLDWIIKYQDVMTAITWDPLPKGTWSQSFVARGNWVTQVGVQQAIEFGPDVQVSIHEGGPTGLQIGPTRTIPTVVVNASSAYWSAGEVPITPGQTYCVNFYVPGGLQTFMGGATIQGGRAYPDGRTWGDGELSPYGPIKCTIYQDTDGIISVVNTKKTNSASLPLSYVSVTTLGQTFTAMGTSLLSFSCLVGNTGSAKMTATLYESPGAGGEGQNQVGMAKYFKAIDWNTRSGCVWKPGEAPITAGQSYYLKIKRADGQAFTAYYVNASEYSGGMMYKDGIGLADADLSTSITAEAFSGSATMQAVSVSGISVARAATSATVTWNTDVATTTDHVDWGMDTPYASQTSATSGGTSHSATLNGLQPNTLYHYRVVSKAANKFDTYSRDFVFATDPNTANLLTNSGFESGLAPWTAFTIIPGDVGVRNYPWTVSGEPNFFGLQARNGGGNRFYGGVRNGQACKGGVYQQVSASVGDEMCLRAWMATWNSDPIGAFFGYTAVARVGIDPHGGTDATSSNVVWGPWNCCQDIYRATQEGNGQAYWTECYATATAQSSTVTAFLEAGSELDTRWTLWGLDDAVMTTATAQSVSRIAELSSVSDGTLVRLTDKVITAGYDDLVGAHYVEEPDRVSGIRVESPDYSYLGERVTVQGRKGTRASGEPYIYNAVLLNGTAGDVLGKLCTTGKSAQAGLLMTVAGRIDVDEFLNYYVNDGSLPAPGLRIRTDGLGFLPEIGDFYSVSGVVQLTGAAPNATPMICPRQDYDVWPVIE